MSATRRTLLFAVLVAVGLTLGWAISNRFMTEPAPLAEAPTGGDFELRSPGGAFRLSDQRGKVVLMYIGYSFCPDVCPTSLALMTQALNALSEQELARVTGLFVSVDPERDDMARLAEYTGYFHPSIVGATGAEEALGDLARRYGAVYRKVEGQSAGGYLMDHSSNTYVVAPDGSLHSILPHATSAEQILQATRSLLSERPTQF